jgi:hypothetical protein
VVQRELGDDAGLVVDVEVLEQPIAPVVAEADVV